MPFIKVNQREEPVINFAATVAGRRKQLRKQLQPGENLAWSVISGKHSQLRDNEAALERHNKGVVETLKKSYQTLIEVVNTLLAIEKGSQRLDRVDSDVLQVLDKCIAQFNTTTSELYKLDLQLQKVTLACLEKHESATSMAKKFAQWSSSLYSEKKDVEDHVKFLDEQIMTKMRKIHQDWGAHDDEIIRQKYLMAMYQGVLKDASDTSMPDGPRGSHHTMLVSMRKTRRKVKQYIKERTSCKKLIKALGNAAGNFSNMASLLVEAGALLKGAFFQMDLIKGRADTVHIGMIKVKDHVCRPDFRSTRDNSLRSVLGLVKSDDEKIETAYPQIKSTEDAIYALINAKLGDGAVERLTANISVELSEFSLDWY